MPASLLNKEERVKRKVNQMILSTDSIKRLISDVSKETIKARPPELKIATYEFLRSKGVPQHKAVKKAAGMRYDKFIKLYEARKPIQKLKHILIARKKIPLVKRYIPKPLLRLKLKELVKEPSQRIPKDSIFKSAQHSTSQKLYSWLVKIDIYNEKTGEDEERFVSVSSNKPLSNLDVKKRAVEIMLSGETSPDLEIYKIKILRWTIDRDYKDKKED